MVILDSMTTFILMIFVSIVAIATIMGYLLTSYTFVNAQTPTTSDLPATIGNESTSNKDLSNNTLPVQNTTTVDTTPPL